MTRETKIGLLVGLAFIIVIGILLSDHLTSSTEAPPATLAHTGVNVRQTVSTPGGTPTAPPIVMAPQGVEPQNPVPTPRELTPPTPPTSIVQVGGPSAAASQPPSQPQTAMQDQALSASNMPQDLMQTSTPTPPADPPITFVPNPQRNGVMADQAPATPTPTAADGPASVLAHLAQQHNEEIVPVGSGGASLQQSATAGGSTEYVVQPGDSLSKIAAKIFGSNTKANRDAIIKLNPSLQQDPDKVIVGRAYRVPAVGAVASSQTQSRPQTTAIVARETSTSATEYWYTVKEGDSLWKIANEQLGKGGTGVAAIKELNKDVLNGGEVVQPNMRLRLPGKPVAQVN